MVMLRAQVTVLRRCSSVSTKYHLLTDTSTLLPVTFSQEHYIKCLPYPPVHNTMFHQYAFIVLAVSLSLTSGQETGIGVGTCTYNFVVQSPYCKKNVGADVAANIQRLQVSKGVVCATVPQVSGGVVCATVPQVSGGVVCATVPQVSEGVVCVTVPQVSGGVVCATVPQVSEGVVCATVPQVSGGVVCAIVPQVSEGVVCVTVPQVSEGVV